jgi:hypothetical protein
MNALELLKEDHAKVKALFDQTQSAEDAMKRLQYRHSFHLYPPTDMRWG